MPGSMLIFPLLCILLPLHSLSQQRYDIMISEFLPDPSPSIGLPESEFVELTNRSKSDVNLRNFKISNGNSSATIKSDYILKADSILILCNSSSAVYFSAFGSVLGLSGFPSLNNEEGNIILYTDAGNVISAVHYTREWFRNDLKAAGGWSLEMMDISNTGSGKDNWKASTAEGGGTPGKKNAVSVQHPDEQPPSLIRAFAVDSVNLVLFFDEFMDSLSAADLSAFLVSDGGGPPDTTFAVAPFFDHIQLHLQKPLEKGKEYEIAVAHISDCSGNEISLRNHCKAGMTEKVKPGDIIFNEILFNPPPYGFDYLELFNRSQRIINCTDLFIASRDPSGSLKDPIVILKEDRAFFPGEYLLLTENPDWVLAQYMTADASTLLSIPSMPSLPDDQGSIVLLNRAGEILDELDYDHHWQSPLLASESGVALERIRPQLPTSLASAWTSAAATAGYGTPGYKNSESFSDEAGSDLISLETKIFSPDMDGYQDFCYIHYQLPSPGFIGSISIYDISGRMVCKLVDNILWGTVGSFRWDGMDDEKNLLPMGHYVICAELFRLDGIVMKRKLVCTLARRY